MRLRNLFPLLSYCVDYWCIYLFNKTVLYMINHDYSPDEIDVYIENLMYERELKKQARKRK